MLSLDPVTQAAYDAFSAAADRAQAILDVMTGTISVRVYEGSTLVGQGTMASPWAVRSGDTLTVGESTAFQVLQDGDPDPGAWSLRFENPDGRWVRGTFGLYGSDADFRWRREDSNAPAPWRTGQYGSIGVAVANALDASGYGGPVTGLVATVNSSTSVTLNWNAYAGATSYQVYRSTTQGSLGTLVLTPTATTYSNSGHTAGTTYYYTVRPVVGGSGVASAEASIVVTTQGGAASIWAMDMSPSAAESAGWTTAQTEACITRTFVSGAGPWGGNAYDLTQIVGAGGDNYYGWSRREIEANVATAGQSRFYRWTVKWISHSGANIVNKMLIPHDSQNGNNERAIFQPEIDASRIVFQFQHDGGANILNQTVARQLDVWFAIQWEIKYSSSPGVADGYWKVWINNTNYAAPTIQQTMVQNVPSGPNYNLMRMGYVNTALASGSHAFRIGGVEVSTAFSPSWSV